ncbi:MAG: ubiquinone biosynthesis protein UbiJ [Woeseiaceae bacterium]|jgi:ubiquinone biosynthesis protein UbiJ
MDALETILRPLAGVMNRQIQMRTPARELCAELDGRVFAVRVRNTALVAYFVIRPTQVFLHTQTDGDPDVVICGSLLSLARLAGGDNEALFRDGSVDLSGDALLAQQFRKLLNYGRPDLEEELAAVVGDVVAHNVGNLVRGAAAWGRQASSTVAQNISEYFQEESRSVPSRYELDSFRAEVSVLRDDVARFEARLNNMEAPSVAQGQS